MLSMKRKPSLKSLNAKSSNKEGSTSAAMTKTSIYLHRQKLLKIIFACYMTKTVWLNPKYKSLSAKTMISPGVLRIVGLNHLLTTDITRLATSSSASRLMKNLINPRIVLPSLRLLTAHTDKTSKGLAVTKKPTTMTNPSVNECKKREALKMINIISNSQWATKIYTAHKTRSQSSTKRSETDQGLQCRKIISKLHAMIKPKQEGHKLKHPSRPQADKGTQLWEIAQLVQPTAPMSK